MKSAFQSDWMKTRLKNLGYTENEINDYIKDILKGFDLSKTSVAENLFALRPLEARTSGSITIKPGVEIGYGKNYNGLGIKPFDQQFIQVTKDGNVRDVVSHEIGGHGTENFDFSVDKFGNQIYSGTRLTNFGKQIAESTGLGSLYYLDPKEQRARFLVTAQDMFEQGLDPNNYSDFVRFMNENKNSPISTNAGQTARFYDIKTLWPAFSKAHSIIPMGLGLGLGLSLSKIPSNKNGGIIKAQKGLGKSTKLIVKQLFKEKPILRSIGSTEDYLRYYDAIFPKSVIQTPYTHGTTYDLSKGLYLTKPIPVTAAPETIKRSDLYLTLQPEAGLQYIPGINSLPNYSWNKQYWALKEILGKPYLTDNYRRIPITALRQQIPNKAGQFDRSDITQVGHGKFLQEYKNDFGLSTLSDEDFLKNLGVRIGETLDEFAKRNREIFKQIYNAGSYINSSKGGLYHIKVDVKNPLLINGGNTYYNERGIFDIVDKNNNDAIIHNNADNEFGTDVLIIPNASPTNVRVLGSEPDIESFYEYVKNK